ncbi:MAG: type I 3-dehydroquinate dehydratase [Bacteroidales bacterium]|nr:type I 3-dehydroquinate dehydratase [Bacteroidales bacterium]
MIATSLQGLGLEELFEILDGGDIEMAEIRLDLCPLGLDDISELFSSVDVPLIATCRGGSREAEEKLLAAISAGAPFIDLEIEAPPQIGKRLRRACSENGCAMVRSFHDFSSTPPLPVLLSTLEKARAFGGEIVKIVTTAQSEADVDTVMGLYRSAAPGTLVAFAMGASGAESRIKCLAMGAPWTYAALSSGSETAPGQFTLGEMKEKVYGSFRLIRPSSPLPMPSSKSFAQRAILCAALADGVSHLEGYSHCGDNESAIALARRLGSSVSIEGSSLAINGIGAVPGCLDAAASGTDGAIVHTGESGFLTRMAIPVLSAISRGPVTVTGEKTLLGRPLSGAHDIMAAFGVRLTPLGETSAPRKIDCYLPLSVTGPLIPGRADVSGKDGSQLISGLLAALPLCSGNSELHVSNPKSIPYLFITLDVLKQFGITAGSEMEGDEDFMEEGDWNLCTGISFKIRGGQRYHSADFRIEADWSGAAAFLVAGAIFGDVTVTGLDTKSLQADLSILDIMTAAGASVSEGAEGDLHVCRAPLRAFDTDLNNCPDLFPVVAVLAAFCEGESHILGTGRLAHKETDRGAAIVSMLTQMGVPARVEEDCLIISGMSLCHRLLTGKLLRGGAYTSHSDHRMVMALSIASLGTAATSTSCPAPSDSTPAGPIDIDDTACVAKSFPGFPELFKKLYS